MAKNQCHDVVVMPVAEGFPIERNLERAGRQACSRSGAIKAARDAGYRPIIKGGMAVVREWAGTDRWVVTVKATPGGSANRY